MFISDMVPSMIVKNRYRILQELGSGAFGHTFVAEDLDVPSRRCCVLKLLKPITDPKQYQLIQERFDREAAILEKLSERSDGQIPKLYAYFAESDLFYLVQEWIDGKTLTQKLTEEGQLGEESVKEILVNMLSILDYVHSQGIIHRDIKPDNIMMRRQGNKLVLIDFGIVKEVITNSFANPTHSIVAGTPAYMPLEQAAGKPVFSSDLYSLGMTAISLLSGKSPQTITDPTTGEIHWREHAPDVSPGFAAILDKAIELNFRERYKTAKEMLEAIQLYSTSTIMLTASPVTPQPAVPCDPVAANQFFTPRGGMPFGFTGTMPTVLRPTQPVPPPAPAPEPVSLPVTNSDATLELAFWDSVKDSTNPKSFEAYLNKYPDGQFAALATIKLDELATKARQVMKTYEFDTVTLDASGNITDFRTGKMQYFTEDLGENVILEMVPIQGGMFQMGSTEQETEKPPHQVRVATFAIGKYPITQAQWRMVAGWPKVNQDLKPEPSFRKGDQRPVEQVSWEDAVEFCARLSQQTGKTYRLPTEAEWEYACRAGTVSPFSVGETITSDIANYDGNFPYASAPRGRYINETLPVGSLGAANSWGLFDMHGNVLEWCQDAWHSNYKGAPTNGIAWEDQTESKRVLRGGSWISNAQGCRSSSRTYKPLDTRNSYNGFRVVAIGDFKNNSQATSPLTQPISTQSTTSTPEPTASKPKGPGMPTFLKTGTEKSMSLNLGNGIKLELVLIQPGTFLMGSPDYENERPIHEVTITNPFYLGIYPVTQAEWKAVMGNNPSNFKGSKNPVENISWLDGQEFLARLCEKDDQYLFRFPTEAEWEYACRAGSTAKFCFGEGKNLLKEYAWYDENARDMTHPVGQKSPNAWGLYDVHGNVYEWCQDWYHDNYLDAPTDGNAWEDQGQHEYKVLRGGSWPYYASYCRAAFRYRATPNNKRSNYGLRVAATFIGGK